MLNKNERFKRFNKNYLPNPKSKNQQKKLVEKLSKMTDAEKDALLKELKGEEVKSDDSV